MDSVISCCSCGNTKLSFCSGRKVFIAVAVFIISVALLKWSFILAGGNLPKPFSFPVDIISIYMFLFPESPPMLRPGLLLRWWKGQLNIFKFNKNQYNL